MAISGWKWTLQVVGFRMRGLLFDSDLGVGAIILVTCNAHILTWRVWRQGLCCCSVADSEFLFESTAQLLFFSECHDKPKTGNSSACKAWSTEFLAWFLCRTWSKITKWNTKGLGSAEGYRYVECHPPQTLGPESLFTWICSAMLHQRSGKGPSSCLFFFSPPGVVPRLNVVKFLALLQGTSSGYTTKVSSYYEACGISLWVRHIMSLVEFLYAYAVIRNGKACLNSEFWVRKGYNLDH